MQRAWNKDWEGTEKKREEVKSRLRCSPSERRGRRRGRGRVGRGVAGLPGDRSKALNRETELVAVTSQVVLDRVINNTDNKGFGLIVLSHIVRFQAVRTYFGILYKCASCAMGMFKWLRKDFVQWDRNRRNLSSPDRRGLNNEAYRSALQAFLDRRREPGEGSESSQSPKSSPTNNCRTQDDHEIYYKNRNNELNKNSDEKQLVPGVPHVEASEVFEVGWVAGTEDRYLELISAEWQHTRIALRRSSHPDCFNAVRADLEVLTEIRHPHTLLLMGTTRTDEHGIVAIFESVDCTLYNHVHEQGERVSVQGAARCAGQLADALRHAHARGIVHGAVSSHCVFLAASGVAKLGGWELAVRENEPRPYREWEERLRSEIFRWQAPEMFYGDAPSKACDVYALALLIWEMCTGRVPWSGLNDTEIECQYVHWDRGVATDTYNFPPLLGNLLEAGLQLEVGKRKLDMNRMHRFLRRLELRYEAESPIYVDKHSNNNNPQIKTFNAPVSTSPLVKSQTVTPKRESIEIGNSLLGKKLFDSEKISRVHKSPNNDIYSKKYDRSFVRHEDGESAACFRAKKNTNVYLESRKKNFASTPQTNIRNEVTDIPGKNSKRDKLAHSDVKRTRRSAIDAEDEISGKKNLVAYESSFSELSTTTATPNSSSDESANDTMTDIKKLKEILATKRSNFFYGNSSPTDLKVSEIPDVTQSSTLSRERILREARGKSCEPCKPASHKINLEPQACKSPTEYNPTLIKPASHQNQRVSQPNVSSELKQTFLHPSTLNSSASSFFETSLWRKEKLICLSKMRKSSPEDKQTMDKKIPSKTPGSPKNNSTFVVDDEVADEESNVPRGESALAIETNLAEDRASPSAPLQALKEALDRATNIVRSTTPNTEESDKLSPVESLNNSDIILDDTGVKESIFESLNRSKLGSNNTDDEIKTIERSTIDDRDSLLVIGKPREEIVNKQFAEEKEKPKCVSFCQTSYDHEALGNDDGSKMFTSKINDSLIQRLHDFTCDDLPNGSTNDPNDSVNYLAEKSLISTAMIFLSSKSQEKNCKSCQHRNLLARRRSLPAGLGQFRSNCNVSPLGRLPIRKAEVPDSTVEDLYIDDEFGEFGEFGERLNINMVLLEDEDEPDDQDLLSSLLHSSNT